MNFEVFGIDVSKWQGEIDWDRAKSKGLDFVFIRAGSAGPVGAYEDSRFKENVEGARAAGFKIGVYWFVKPGYSLDSQVEMLIALTTWADPDFPPVLDVEDHGNLTPSNLRAKILSFAERIKDHFGKVMIYTAPAWWNAWVARSHWFADYDLWIAHWGLYPANDTPMIPLDWKDAGEICVFWQTHVGSDGRDHGMESKGLDHDLWYGTHQEYLDYIADYGGNPDPEPEPCPDPEKCPECPDEKRITRVETKLYFSNGDTVTYELEQSVWNQVLA